VARITEDYSNAPQPQGKKRGLGGNASWILIVSVTLFVIALPTMILLLFGMLPSMVALIIDRSKGKSAASTVSAVNFIGVFPYIMDLWKGGNNIDQALGMLDIFTMLIMYSAAAMGWLLFMSAPPVISSFVMVLQQRKIANLRKQQKSLIEEWGPDVAALTEGFNEEGGKAPHDLQGNAEPQISEPTAPQ